VQKSLQTAGILILIASLGTICFTARGIYRAARSSSWPSTQGRTVASGVDRKVGRYGTYFEVWVHYAYSVNGISYEGRNLQFATSSRFSRDDAYTAIKIYRPGSPIEVFYDPQEPGLAVLKPGAAWYSGIQVLLLTTSGVTLLFLAKFMGVIDHREAATRQ
jgi:hypothetical protein